MNIYEALKKDHDAVQELLRELVSLEAGDEKRRSGLIEEIRDELIPHSRAEEAVLYNAMREAGGATGLVAHGYKEHVMAETLLRTLQIADSIDAGWKETAKSLKSAIDHHIQEEEGEIFSAAKKIFSAEQAKTMGKTFVGLKPSIKEQSLGGTTVDLLANLLPPKLAEALNVGIVK